MATAASATDPLGYYAVLGLAYDASPDDVRRAYRREAKRWHPDRNSSSDAADRMVRLNQAYDVLNDAGQRAGYDRGAFASSNPEPPRPVAYPAAVDFGTLRSGDRLTGMVRVGNAGGPFGTIRVEPDFGTWFRVAAARGGLSGDVVVELDFEASVPDGSALTAGRQRETVRIFLDEEFVDVALEVDIVGSPAWSGHAAPTAAPTYGDPSALGSPGWLTELGTYAKRLALAFVTGVVDPFALVALGRQLQPGWFVALVLLAVGLFGLTAYAAYRTRVFTRVDAAPSGIRLLSSGVFFLGKASIALSIVALVVFIVLAILVVLVALVIMAIAFGIVAAALGSS